MNKFLSLALLTFTIFTVSCAESAIKADSQTNFIPEIDNQEPVKASLCEIQNDPGKYNHKLVQVTGFFSHGFENSTAFDPSCSSEQCIWFEYGGTSASGTMYCCGVSAERNRTEPLIVENIPIPLVDDENFRAFDKLLQRPPNAVAHATVLGRFFSGKKMDFAKSSAYGGYGHMGMCSLFAVQKVIAIDSQNQKDLDYRASDYYQPVLEKADSYEFLDVYNSSKDLIELQQKAESGEREWSFNNPQRVAVEAFARLSKTNEKSITGINQLRQSQGSFDYRWRDKKQKTDYVIVVNRPCWLSFYAKDPKKVAWVVFAGYKIP